MNESPTCDLNNIDSHDFDDSELYLVLHEEGAAGTERTIAQGQRVRVCWRCKGVFAY